MTPVAVKGLGGNGSPKVFGERGMVAADMA